MKVLTITLAALATSLAATAATTSNSPSTLAETKAADSLSPPGLNLVKGGRTKIGTSFKDMVKLIEEHQEAREKAAGMLGEVPQHTVSVDDFFLMVSEVTNEQYREYVVAAKVQPPLLWGEKAIGPARTAFLEEDAKKRREAKEAGKPSPERGVFDAYQWWERNWKDAEWEMPEALAKKPVVYVDYQNARGYAEWAGLRLPTEEEWERAVRGDKDDDYTWGDDWKPGHAVTKELRSTSDVMDVGSFPNGANQFGIQDLHGNVWEWTDSKYVAYPKWKHESFKVGKGRLAEEIDKMPKFSADRRVVRGGSQQTGKVFARGSTRGGFDRHQKASVLGFRCAASEKPGLDFAVNAMDVIPNEIRPQNAKGPVMFDPTQVIARDRWIANNGGSDLSGYQVITKYDYILFTPVESLETNGLADIRKGTQTDEIYHIGFLVTNQDMVEPALRAGTYLVAIRGEGKYPKRVEDEEADADGEDPKPAEAQDIDAEEELGQSTLRVDEFLEIDPMVDNYLFIDMTGTPVAAMPAESLDYGNPKAGAGSADIVDKAVMITVPANDPKDPEATEEIEVQQQWLDTSFFIKGRSRKGLKATLSLRFAEGLLDGEWR